MLVVASLCLATCIATAQNWDTIPLNDFSAFAEKPPNWSIVGAASGQLGDANLNTDRGIGVVYSRSRNGENFDLISQFTHGDMDLDLEFMLPEGGESGVLLQGQYEIQLKDSWQRERPTYLDAGAIPPRSAPESQELVGGKRPRVNAAKAPGLWQHLSISFRAARFDQYGQKIEHARLLFVKLNGLIIHENVSLTTSTSGSSTDELARGPLVLEGNSSQVAFRNICVQRYESPPLRWKSLRYESGEMINSDTYQMPAQIEESGTAEWIDPRVTTKNEKIALRFDGEIDLAVDGLYTFEVEVWWNARLTIDGQATETTPSSSNGATQLELAAGTHRIVLEYYKYDSWYQSKLALYLSGPGVARQPLHEETALPVSALPTPHLVDFDREAQVLRAFTHYSREAGSSTMLTHTAHVGLPEGLAFTYDLLRAIPVQVWRGEFLDATPMWSGRGDGSASALGATTVLDTLPPWMNSETAAIRPRGYKMNEGSIPTFVTQVDDLILEDRLEAIPNLPGLTRQMSWSGESDEAPIWRLASGLEIEKIDRFNYLIDQAYYLRLDDDNEGQAEVVLADERAHLVFTAEGDQIIYQIIW